MGEHERGNVVGESAVRLAALDEHRDAAPDSAEPALHRDARRPEIGDVVNWPTVAERYAVASARPLTASGNAT